MTRIVGHLYRLSMYVNQGQGKDCDLLQGYGIGVAEEALFIEPPLPHFFPPIS